MDSDAIRAYDKNGQEYLISRDEYRAKVLPDQFRDAFGDPDRLYGAIVMALRDKFFTDAVAPARRLLEIDSNRERASTVLGIALTNSGELEAAEELFNGYVRDHGVSGVILTNLAKVLSQRGEEERSKETLWRALVADPNQLNALDWWGAIHRDQRGEPGFLEAMQRVADLPGSWRAQLWLARKLLKEAKAAEAVALYRTILPSASTDGQALMMITGDLGNAGHARDALDLVAPYYDPSVHGPVTGFNLVQACIQLRELDLGRRILEGVERLNRYDLLEHVRALRTRLG